jgi:hypothetical protein
MRACSREASTDAGARGRACALDRSSRIGMLCTCCPFWMRYSLGSHGHRHVALDAKPSTIAIVRTSIRSVRENRVGLFTGCCRLEIVGSAKATRSRSSSGQLVADRRSVWAFRGFHRRFGAGEQCRTTPGSSVAHLQTADRDFRLRIGQRRFIVQWFTRSSIPSPRRR